MAKYAGVEGSVGEEDEKRGRNSFNANLCTTKELSTNISQFV